MSICKNDDVLFSTIADLEGASHLRGELVWARIRTAAGRLKHFAPENFDLLNIKALPWPSDKVRVTFAARVVMPIYKDGELVALQVENHRGQRCTVRFSEYGDLIFTNLSDEMSVA